MAEAGAPKFLWQHRERLGSTACPSLGGCTSWAWTIKPRSQRRGKAGTRAWRAAGHTDSQRAPRRPAALRSWLPPTSTAGFPRPLSHGFQQGLCPDPGSTLTNTWWPVKVYRLNNDKQWDDQGAGHVVQLCGVAEGMSVLVWATGRGNGKPLQYSCLKSPMNTRKRQKVRTPGDELRRLVGAQYAAGEEWRNNGETPETIKRHSQSEKNTQLWMWLVMEVKSDAIKNNIA